MLAVFLSFISQMCWIPEFTLTFLFCQIIHWNYVINTYLKKATLAKQTGEENIRNSVFPYSRHGSSLFYGRFLVEVYLLGIYVKQIP